MRFDSLFRSCFVALVNFQRCIALLAVGWSMTMATAQSPLTTLFAGNSNIVTGSCLYFDLTVLDPGGITILRIDVNGFTFFGGSPRLHVFTIPGTRVGNQTNFAAWNGPSSFGNPVTMAGWNNPSVATLLHPITLPQGRHGIALQSSWFGHSFTSGNGSNQNYANADAAIECGEFTNASFTGTVYPNCVANCSIHYLPAGKKLLVPGNMHLGGIPSSARLNTVRNQIVYDSTHFTNAGVTGPVWISRLRFRAMDGVPNLGGQMLSGLTVRVGTAAVDYNSMSNIFANNIGALGPVGTTSITLPPVANASPNDWVIDLDLAALGAAVFYDPTLGADLLLDFSLPVAPPTGGMELQATWPGSLTRGRLLTSYTLGATTGAFDDPPVILFDFAGPGGTSNVTPARAEQYGAACGGDAATFHQTFALHEPVDLSGRGFTLTPDNLSVPNHWTVTGSAPPPDLSKVNPTPNALADDMLVTHSLGFLFRYPGGSTTTIRPCSNGFLWLDPAMTVTDPIVTRSTWLGHGYAPTPRGARLAPFWYDFSLGVNIPTHPNCGLHVMTDTSGGFGNRVCYVTWLNVGSYGVAGGQSVSTMQCVLREQTGVVEFRYGAMMPTLTGGKIPGDFNGITGFTRGLIGTTMSVDPGSRDLSHETPFTTSIEGTTPGLLHGTTARMIQGTAVNFTASNIPATVSFGLMLVGFAPQQPGLAFPPLASSCVLSLAPAQAVIYELFVVPGPSVTSASFSVPSSGFLGAQLFTQFAGLDNSGALLTSNAIRHTIGLN